MLGMFHVERLHVGLVVKGFDMSESAAEAKVKADADAKAKADADVNAKADADEAAKKKANEKTLSQQEVDLIVEDRLRREREKAGKDAERVKRESEEAAALKNNEFEKVATERAKRITELEPQIEKLTAELEDERKRRKELEESIEASVKTRLEALKVPAHITELLDTMELAQKFSWLSKHETELTSTDTKTRPPGAPPTPKGDATGGANGKKAMTDEELANKAAGTAHSMF